MHRRRRFCRRRLLQRAAKSFAELIISEISIEYFTGWGVVKFHLPVIFILIKLQTVPLLHLVHGRHTEDTNSMSSSSAHSALEILWTVLYNRHNNKTCNARTNVTLRRVRITIVTVENQQVLHILSVCL